MEVAASVIAIVQISGKIASLLKTYIEGVRDAQEDIKRLYASIKGLEAITAKITPSKDGDNSPTVASIVEELQNLQKKLDKHLPIADPRARRWAKKLMWPFQKADVDKIVGNIERGKTTLILEFEASIR